MDEFTKQTFEAARLGDLATVRAAVLSGRVSAEQTDAAGRRLLNAASLLGHIGVVRFLVEEAGADVNGRSDASSPPYHQRGSTALHAAANNNNLECVRYLLSKGADRTPAMQQEAPSSFFSALTPLHQAAAKGHQEIVEALLAAGADPKATMMVQIKGAAFTFTGVTPLHYACFTQQDEIVRYLASIGLNVNLQDRESGVAPIHMAASLQDGITVRTLASLGADLNVRMVGPDGCGMTALHIATKYRRPRAAVALLECGADPTIPDDEGRIPLQLAIGAQHQELETILRQKMGLAIPAAAAPAPPTVPAPAGQTSQTGGSDMDEDESDSDTEDDEPPPEGGYRLMRRLDPQAVQYILGKMYGRGRGAGQGQGTPGQGMGANAAGPVAQPDGRGPTGP